MNIIFLIPESHPKLDVMVNFCSHLRLDNSVIEKADVYVLNSYVMSKLPLSNLPNEFQHFRMYDFIYFFEDVKTYKDNIHHTAHILYQQESSQKSYPNQAKQYKLNQSVDKFVQMLRRFVEDIEILKAIQLLNIKSYQNKTKLTFASSEKAYQHFLLIGRFIGFSDLVYPYWLISKNQQLIDWDALAKKQRIQNKVSIVIPVYNNIKITIECLRSLNRYTQCLDFEVEIIVVNNGSKHYHSTILNLYAKLLANVKVINLNNNLNFSIGCNIGFTHTTGEYVLFLNNDTLFTDGWLQALVSEMKNKNPLAIQPKLVYPNGKIQCAGVYFADDGFGKCRLDGEVADSDIANTSMACHALTGACLLLHCEDFIAVQGFEPIFINGQEDMDLSLKLRQSSVSRPLWYCADSTVIHATSQTEGRGRYIGQNRTIFATRWHKTTLK